MRSSVMEANGNKITNVKRDKMIGIVIPSEFAYNDIC